MLAHFRYSALLGLVLIVVLAVFAGQGFKHYALEKIVEEPLAENSQKLFQSFSQDVLCRYRNVLRDLNETDTARWKNDSAYERFQKVSSKMLSLSQFAIITIYLQDERVLFSTYEHDKIFFDKEYLDTSSSFGSRVISSMAIRDRDGMQKEGSFFHFLAQVSTDTCTSSDENIVFNFEVLEDITPLLNSISFFQYVVILGIILIFILLYIFLFFASRRSEKIISLQHEDKIQLERDKMEAENQSEQKSMFLANISHELRTPLNSVIGFSEILKNEVMGPIGNQQYKDYVTDINASGRHLLSLINDILDYSKAEARKLNIDLNKLNLVKSVKTCLRLVEPKAKEGKVSLETKIPKKEIFVDLDGKRIKQVILNLLSNSVKFTPKNGTVRLSIAENIADNNVVIIVSDTGIGIAPKDISKALSPFGQVQSEHDRQYEGTGLGLPLTKKLTELMGGSFEIKSEPGLGTTVTLTFAINHKELSPSGSKDEF